MCPKDKATNPHEVAGSRPAEHVPEGAVGQGNREEAPKASNGLFMKPFSARRRRETVRRRCVGYVLAPDLSSSPAGWSMTTGISRSVFRW